MFAPRAFRVTKSTRAICLLAAPLLASCASVAAPLVAQSAAGAASDTTSLLGAGRIARLGAGPRGEWQQYIERSSVGRARDEALLTGELKTVGRATMTRAPMAATSFSFDHRTMTAAYFATDAARQMAESMLTFQTPTGGWSKHVDFSQGKRQPGQSFFSENDKWQYIATIDNDATTSEMRFLAAANSAKRDVRFETSVNAGIRYLLDAQFPTGCWPQVWPLQGGYHDAATFNDNAIVEILLLLDEAARGVMSFVPDSLRSASAKAVTRAIGCVLNAQVQVNGVYTVWGQQHDPITLAATSARSYELTSLTSKESAALVDVLMQHSETDARIPDRVHAAADWFVATQIKGMRYEQARGLVPDSTATPVWPRMSEIGTNRAIFSNRDGIKLYEYDKLTDRRTGYGWYADSPAGTLKRYRAWAVKHPRVAPSGVPKR